MTSLQLVYFKPNEDILQGISKLDHLLQVSIFQIERNPGRRISIINSLKEETHKFKDLNTNNTSLDASVKFDDEESNGD